MARSTFLGAYNIIRCTTAVHKPSHVTELRKKRKTTLCAVFRISNVLFVPEK